MNAIADLTADMTDDEVAHLAATYARMHISFADDRIAAWYWRLTCALADEYGRRAAQLDVLAAAAGEVGALAAEDDEDLSDWVADPGDVT